MKKFVLITCLLAVFQISKSQVRSCNLEVTLMSPIQYDFIQTDKPMAVSVKIRNLGPDAITAKDTVIYTLLYDGDSVMSGGKPMTKAYKGYVLNANQEAVEPVYTGISLNYNTGGIHKYCVDVKLLNRSTTGANDPGTTNNRSCHDVYVTIFTNGINSTNASQNGNISVSPNPAGNTATISYTVTEKSEVKIAVTDIQGRVVETLLDAPKGVGNYEQNIDLSNYKAGIYFVQYYMNGQCYTTKLVKN